MATSTSKQSAVDLGALQKQMQSSAAVLRRAQANFEKAYIAAREAEAAYCVTKREFEAAFASVAASAKVIL